MRIYSLGTRAVHEATRPGRGKPGRDGAGRGATRQAGARRGGSGSGEAVCARLRPVPRPGPAPRAQLCLARSMSSLECRKAHMAIFDMCQDWSQSVKKPSK
jgi:hypothetical protein